VALATVRHPIRLVESKPVQARQVVSDKAITSPVQIHKEPSALWETAQVFGPAIVIPSAAVIWQYLQTHDVLQVVAMMTHFFQ
jgi:hypothetical protein